MRRRVKVFRGRESYWKPFFLSVGIQVYGSGAVIAAPCSVNGYRYFPNERDGAQRLLRTHMQNSTIIKFPAVERKTARELARLAVIAYRKKRRPEPAKPTHLTQAEIDARPEVGYKDSDSINAKMSRL